MAFSFPEKRQYWTDIIQYQEFEICGKETGENTFIPRTEHSAMTRNNCIIDYRFHIKDS